MYGQRAQAPSVQIQLFVQWVFPLAIYFSEVFLVVKTGEMRWIVIEKWYNSWIRRQTILFADWIYIARGPWYYKNFCNIFLPNIDEDQKNFII